MRLRNQYTLGIGGLICWSLFVLAAALLTEQNRYAHQISTVAAGNLSESLQRQIEKHGVSMASTLATRLVSPLYYSDFRLVEHEAREQRGHDDVLSAVVVDSSGVVIRGGGNPREGGDERLEQPWVREALSTGKPATSRDGNLLHVAAPATAGGHVLGAVVLELSTEGILGDIREEQTRLGNLIRAQTTSLSLTGFAIGIVLVTIAIFAAYIVAGSLARPVTAFAARARRIGKGELSTFLFSQRSDEIGDLSRAFDEMAATLRDTTVSKEYFDNVLRSMADMLLVVGADGRVVTANPSCLAELGCDEAALRGRRVDEFLPDFRSVMDHDPGPANHPDHYLHLLPPGGDPLPVRVAAAPLRESESSPAGHVLVMQNVAERVAAQEQIARSLAEKEILLREIHHRVKNNLQIISSMLSLQGARSDDDHMRAIFQESEVRIRAMALVHEQLYRSGDLAHVDLGTYLDTLSQQVVRYFGRGDCTVDVAVDEELREVSVDQAIPIGLIVNELVANSVQHGFPRTRGGKIQVRLNGGDEGRALMVADNGTGYPPTLDVEKSDSLGLRLVSALTEQLGGRFVLSHEGGACCRVELPPAVSMTARIARKVDEEMSGAPAGGDGNDQGSDAAGDQDAGGDDRNGSRNSSSKPGGDVGPDRAA